MKRLMLGILSFVIMNFIGLSAAADQVADKTFANKFLSYKIKNKTSVLQTAEAFAKQSKKTPEQLIARFVGAQFSMEKNADLAVVYGLEGFQDVGHSFDEALEKISDLTGQMPSTLQAMNETSRFKSKRDTAALPKKKSLASR